MRLYPSVRLLFAEGARLRISGNGVFQAVGTAENPISISGFEATPGYWEGIEFHDSPWENNLLSHVTLSHAGNVDSITPTYAALELDESTIIIINSTISNNQQWGILCNDPQFPDRPSIILDGGGNTFIANRSGDLDGDCEVRSAS